MSNTFSDTYPKCADVPTWNRFDRSRQKTIVCVRDSRLQSAHKPPLICRLNNNFVSSNSFSKKSIELSKLPLMFFWKETIWNGITRRQIERRGWITTDIFCTNIDTRRRVNKQCLVLKTSCFSFPIKNLHRAQRAERIWLFYQTRQFLPHVCRHPQFSAHPFLPKQLFKSDSSQKPTDEKSRTIIIHTVNAKFITITIVNSRIKTYKQRFRQP